jgi:hypothetical protein
MPSLLDQTSESAKILYVGDSGHGKTGSKAALVAIGYKLRMVDTDNGFKILRSLLTDDEHYPYASWMKKAGIDPTEPGRISYIPIDVPIDVQDRNVQRKSGNVSYSVLAPASSRAWNTVVNLLNKGWIDDGKNLGLITDWDNDTILDFDTLSSLAELAHYWNQDMNGRLGALEDDHGRDAGAAQELIRRLMLKLTSPTVRCNVIVTTHITWTDVSRGAALSPRQLMEDKKPVELRGFPSVIGRALGPVLGKRWNDQFICARDGDGRNATRRIYSVPTNNVDAKHSAWVEDSYPVETGLASIFSALQYKPVPTEFLEHVAAFNAARSDTSPTESPSGSKSNPFGGFGR